MEIVTDTSLAPSVISAVIMSLKIEPLDEIALLAISCIAFAGESSRVLMRQGGVCAALVSALNSAHDAESRSLIAEAMSNLCQEAEGVEALFSAHACPSVVAALRSSTADADAQNQLAMVIANFCECENEMLLKCIKMSLIESGACAALVTALPPIDSMCIVALAIYQLALDLPVAAAQRRKREPQCRLNGARCHNGGCDALLRAEPLPRHPGRSYQPREALLFPPEGLEHGVAQGWGRRAQCWSSLTLTPYGQLGGTAKAARGGRHRFATDAHATLRDGGATT